MRSCSVALTGTADAAPSDHYGVVAVFDLDAVALGGGQGLDAWAKTEALLWPEGRG